MYICLAASFSLFDPFHSMGIILSFCIYCNTHYFSLYSCNFFPLTYYPSPPPPAPCIFPSKPVFPIWNLLYVHRNVSLVIRKKITNFWLNIEEEKRLSQKIVEVLFTFFSWNFCQFFFVSSLPPLPSCSSPPFFQI